MAKISQKIYYLSLRQALIFYGKLLFTFQGILIDNIK